MKITKPELKHYIIVLILIFSGYFSLRTIGITVSDKSWKCRFVGEKCICKVHFILQSKSRRVSECKISIRGIRYVSGAYAQALRIIGEKNINITVNPEKPVEGIETIELKRKPDDIRINIWENKN